MWRKSKTVLETVCNAVGPNAPNVPTFIRFMKEAAYFHVHLDTTRHLSTAKSHIVFLTQPHSKKPVPLAVQNAKTQCVYHAHQDTSSLSHLSVRHASLKLHRYHVQRTSSSNLSEKSVTSTTSKTLTWANARVRSNTAKHAQPILTVCVFCARKDSSY